jgi:hypothetical protein
VKLVPGVPEESSSQEESTCCFPQDNGDGELCIYTCSDNAINNSLFALIKQDKQDMLKVEPEVA